MPRLETEVDMCYRIGGTVQNCLIQYRAYKRRLTYLEVTVLYTEIENIRSEVSEQFYV